MTDLDELANRAKAESLRLQEGLLDCVLGFAESEDLSATRLAEVMLAAASHILLQTSIYVEEARKVGRPEKVH